MDHITRDDIRNTKSAWNSLLLTSGTAITNTPTTTFTYQVAPQQISVSDEIDVLISIINQLIDEVNKKADKK